MEQYEEIIRCPHCRKERLTNEDMGTWMCPCRAAPVPEGEEKLLDKLLQDSTLRGLIAPIVTK